MITITNYPELSEAFKNEAVRSFFLQFLINLEEPYNIKEFLIDGAVKTFEEQMEQLSKSFIVIKKSTKDDDGYDEVERCVDGVRFKLGDMVVDKANHVRSIVLNEVSKLPISRLYEDDRGLHVKLQVDKDSFTWRDLSMIEH